MAIRTINKHNLINLNINMNFRYNFSENSKADLLEFVKEAQKQKDNKYCDLEQYKLWKKMLPLDSNIEKALEVSKEVIEIMDSESFEELPDIKNTETLNDLVEENINNSIVVEDVTYAIKENLEKIKEVPKSVIRDIEDYPVDKLKGSLMLLSEELNFEDVVNLGNSLVRFNCSESVFSVYFQTLLSTKLRSEYSDKLHSLLFKIESYTNGVLANEISRVLLEEKEAASTRTPPSVWNHH
ncbi:unnamed protein product [Brassicogethes aeneus]|uniref:Uncharacterized protein n=1 Tax=Brassicogethes aeneus TaxID=1431903 RepID=A0A9P0AYA0_BRAAE|nr:unnamed protein product [Brassicogethes aeneus]